MPPRIATVNTASSGFESWWSSLPPVTRIYGAACFIMYLGMAIGAIPGHFFILFYKGQPVLQRVLNRLEIWRLFTNFLFIGSKFQFLIRLIWIFTYGAALERETFAFDPADYVYMYLVSFLGLDVIGLLTGVPVMGVSFVMVLIYIWSKNFPDQQVSLYGLVKIQSFYMPFAFVAISLIMGDSIWPEVYGIAVGHLYFFLHTLYPRASGKQVLVTPSWLRNLLADWGLGRRPPATAAVQTPGFQAFRGSGRRLGDN